MLKGKKALITGGSRGLGKAVALAFAKEGIDVAITGRNEKLLKEVKEELEMFGISASYAVFDVSDFDEVQKGLQQILNEFGKIDILVNNAGIAKFGTFIEMSPEDFGDIIQTNVMGMYYVTKTILPQMIALNEGDIFNVSSTAGLAGNATTSAYSASKFAVIGMSESLMKEVRKNNIRVTTLTPSTIASDMSMELGLTDGNPDKVLQPDDFAELIVATLKLPRRAFIKSVSIWSTNP